MESQSHRIRRNSIERYQPKNHANGDDLTDKNHVNGNNLTDKNHANGDVLTDKMQKVNLKDDGDGKQPTRSYSSNQNRNRRRGVNNHLYPKYSQTTNHNHNCNHNKHQDGGNQSENPHQPGWGQRDEAVSFSHSAQGHRPYQHKQRPHEQSLFSKDQPRKKNTETFKPSHKPADMRILSAHAGWKKYSQEITSRDVLIVHDLFCTPDDLTIYDKLLNEMKNSGIEEEDLWQLWHGDSHVIADDKKRWKEACPTFHMVLDEIRNYFEMEIKATRLNWYRDSKEWKPFHHDAAAIKPDKAKTQNFTVAVSFGAERDAAFEHATTKTVISMPQPNGTIYVFAKDVNVIWRHGILQVPPEKYHDQGRISIIAWGWVTQTQV